MRAISFAWTTPALVAGRKTVTRREWKLRYAQSWHEGDVAAAWDKQPRFKGARRVAVIRLTADPRIENTRDLPEADWENEGFAYLEERGLLVDGHSAGFMWRGWKILPRDFWVVRFELVDPPVGGELNGVD